MAGVNPVRRALARAVAELERSGVASPRADAEQLAAHVLGVPRGRLALVDTFPPPAAARFPGAGRPPGRTGAAAAPHRHGRVRRAGAGGRAGVFIPRPETELLAQWAVAQPASVVVDLGSGTGALALSIAHARPQARVYAVEASAAARAWLRRNAADRARAGDRPIEVVAGDADRPGRAVRIGWNGGPGGVQPAVRARRGAGAAGGGRARATARRCSPAPTAWP